MRFVRDDVASQHQTMVKLAQDKHVWLVGGGDLVGQFYDQGLLEEMRIQTVAVFLNEGKKLFARKTDQAFKITNIESRGETCIEVSYRI